jgi:hypothetical protein
MKTTNRTKTPAQRAADVASAAFGLNELVQDAIVKLSTYGADDPRTHNAWEAVEIHGATIHRQARLLAGKSRGG